MPGIFKNGNLMDENNSRILKWFLWLQNFYFEIIYKLGCLDCLADMLTREQKNIPTLGMMSSKGASSRNPPPKKNKKEWKVIDENDVEHATRQLQYNSLMKPEDRQRYLKVVNEVVVEKYMDATLIKDIKE